MLRIFKKLRLSLLGDMKLSKYFAYALGEIFLIILGILIALQINNWNEERKQDKHFDRILAQIYTNNKCDIGWHNWVLDGLYYQDSILSLLEKEKLDIQTSQLPYLLYFLDASFNRYNTNSKYLLSQIRFENGSDKKSNIVSQINSFYNVWEVWEENIENSKTEDILPMLQEENITHFGPWLKMDFSSLDTTYFSSEDIIKVKSIMNKVAFKNNLRKVFERINYHINAINNRITDASSVMYQIKEYNPDINLVFQNIGIVGSALEYGWDRSVPMKLTDEEKSIWEINIYMKSGEFKFRERNSWNQNWGGSSSHIGKAKYYGGNIRVTEGKYHIILNLSEDKYLIEKIN